MLAALSPVLLTISANSPDFVMVLSVGLFVNLRSIKVV
jgi:hypothetical protein